MTILEALVQLRDDLKTWVTNNLKVKVDIEDGKGLSTNDYTTAEKEKLAALSVDKDNNLSALDGYATEEYVNEQISSNIADLATKTYVDGKMDTAIELPTVTSADNGAVLGVVDGKWAITTILNAEEVEF